MTGNLSDVFTSPEDIEDRIDILKGGTTVDRAESSADGDAVQGAMTDDVTEEERAALSGEGVGHRQLLASVEALLFVSDEPVSAVRLAQILEVQPGEAASLLAELAIDYQESGRGIQLREVAGGWRFYSHPAYHEVIERYVLSWDTRKLSQAALETLAVVAYRQPVTRQGIAAVRGVNSDGVVSSLMEKGLVREMGREGGLGTAILYGTTHTFLEKFGLKNLDELPPLEDFAPNEAARGLIRERLSGGSAVSSKAEDTADVDHDDILYAGDVDGDDETAERYQGSVEDDVPDTQPVIER